MGSSAGGDTPPQVPVVDITEATRPSTPNQSQASSSVSFERYPLPPGAAHLPSGIRPRTRPLQDSPERLDAPLPSTPANALGLSFTSSVLTHTRRSRTSTDRLLPAQAAPNDIDPFEYFTPPPVPKSGFWRLEGDVSFFDNNNYISS